MTLLMASTMRYAALGDSFSAGTQVKPEEAFPVLLANEWREKHGKDFAFKNLAVGGFTSKEVVSQELPQALAFQPTIVTYESGANDIVRNESLADYRKNVHTVLQALKGAKIFCVSQPDWPHSEGAQHFGRTPEEYFEKVVEANAILKDEANKAGATYVDLFSLMQQQYAKKMWGPDGLHPNAQALAEWAKALWPVVK